MRLAARIAILLMAAAAGCGGSSTAPSSGGNNNNNPPPNPNSSSITVNNDFFDPSTTTVAVGTKVTWTWNACSGDGYGGTTCVAHQVLFDDGTTSGMQSDGTWSRTFTAAGTYKYHCTVHGTAMSGVVTVQ